MPIDLAGGGGKRIEAEYVFRLAVRAVADKTFVGKDRENFAGEVNGRVAGVAGCVKRCRKHSNYDAKKYGGNASFHSCYLFDVFPLRRLDCYRRPLISAAVFSIPAGLHAFNSHRNSSVGIIES
jgi:hypothetical protein